MPAPARRTPASRPVRPVRKAADVMAVYDQAGNLLGTCNVSDVRELVQHPASKPPAKADPLSPQLRGEMDNKQGPPDSLQPQPSDAAGTPAHGRPSSGQVVAKARRAGLPLRDAAEVEIAKRAAARVRDAIGAGFSPAGVATVQSHAAGQAAEELRQHRAARAGRDVAVRKAAEAAGVSPGDDVLAAGYDAHGNASRRLSNSTPGGALPDQSDAPTVHSWEAAQAALVRLRGGG